MVEYVLDGSRVLKWDPESGGYRPVDITAEQYQQGADGNFIEEPKQLPADRAVDEVSTAIDQYLEAPNTDRFQGTEYARGLGRHGLQGLSFGFGDELEAMLTPGVPYDDAVGDIRGEIEAFADEHPIASTASEIGGGFVGGSALAKYALGALPPPLRTGTLPRALAGSRFARDLLGGTMGGALAGYGAAEGENDVASTVWGGLLGMLTGGLANPIIGAARSVGRRLFEPITDRMHLPQTHAAREVEASLDESGMTIPQARAELNEMGPEAMIGDLGPGPTGTMQALGLERPSRGVVTEALEARHVGQQRRLRQALDETLGGQQGRFWELNEEILAQQRAAAGPAYQRAYDVVIEPTAQMRELLDRPVVQRAWQRAQDAAAITGERLPETPGADVMPSVQGWDWIKRGLDDMIEEETDSVSGKVSRTGARLIRVKNEILDEIDRATEFDGVSLYRSARDQFAGRARILDAMERGRNILREDYELSERAIREMSESEREAFRVGAAREVIDRIESAKISGNAAFRADISAPKFRRRLRAAFPDQDSYDEFYEVLDREADFGRTRNDVLYNSATAARQASRERLASRQYEGVPGNQATLTGMITDAILERRLQPHEYEILADMMTAQGTNADAQLQEVMRLLTESRFRRALNFMQVPRGTTATTAGGQVGAWHAEGME